MKTLSTDVLNGYLKEIAQIVKEFHYPVQIQMGMAHTDGNGSQLTQVEFNYSDNFDIDGMLLVPAYLRYAHKVGAMEMEQTTRTFVMEADRLSDLAAAVSEKQALIILTVMPPFPDIEEDGKKENLVTVQARCDKYYDIDTFLSEFFKK